MSETGISVASYRRLVEQIRAAVQRSTAEDATIAVISRGDEELMRLGGRRAWHFPQGEDGHYAGFHPASGQEAIAHLEALRRGGADHLLVPRTAFWWLEHYADFASYLESAARLVSGADGACRIYRLPGARGGALPAAAGAPAAAVRQAATFLDALLPERAALAVVGGDTAEALGRLRPGAVAVPAADLSPRSAGLAERVAELAGLVDFLFVPREAWAEWDGDRLLLAALAPRFTMLAEREHLGTLFGAANDTNDEFSRRKQA